MKRFHPMVSVAYSSVKYRHYARLFQAVYIFNRGSVDIQYRRNIYSKQALCVLNKGSIHILYRKYTYSKQAVYIFNRRKYTHSLRSVYIFNIFSTHMQYIFSICSIHMQYIFAKHSTHILNILFLKTAYMSQYPTSFLFLNISLTGRCIIWPQFRPTTLFLTSLFNKIY